MFYPADPAVLRTQVRSYLDGASMPPDDRVIGIVAPHAGYVYSGPTAGLAWAVAPSRVDTVVIAAPCHRVPVAGASTFGGSAYETPLGAARVDEEMASYLQAAGHAWVPRAHVQEHAEEVQVPFVQERWPEALILPLVLGAMDPASVSVLASDIHHAGRGRRVLFAASSDLSHYHGIKDARRMDGIFMEDFRKGSAQALLGHVQSGASEACGAAPVLVLMAWADLCGPWEAEIVGYNTSASASGDTSAVVGYMAGAVRLKS